MKRVLICWSLAFSFGLSAGEQLQEIGMNEAFECSIYAAIASQTAEEKNERREWRSEATNWLDLAYTKGGTDTDYQNVPEEIVKEYEGLSKKNTYTKSVNTYHKNGCHQSL